MRQVRASSESSNYTSMYAPATYKNHFLVTVRRPCGPQSSHVTQALYLQEGLLLFEVFANHGCDVVSFRIGSQLVGPTAPVLFSFVLLLQALQDTADLRDKDPGSGIT